MANLTPQQIADKQVRNATNAVQSYIDGINAVTESPTAKAAQNLDKYLMGTQQAVASGKMAERLNAVSTASWKNSATTKGGQRYAPGVTAAKPKIVAFQTQFTPFRRQVAAQVRQMDSSTFEARMQRMVANATGLHQFKFTPPPS